MNAFTLTEGSAAAGRSWNERVDWDAVTGITTVLAATAAVIAGALAIRVFLHDRAKAEAEQASQVAVWPVFQPFKGNFRWMTCLTNTSRLPVYDWWLEYEVETEKPAGVWTVHTKKNWLNETVLPPTVPAREFLHPRPLRQMIPEDERQEWRVRIRVNFADAAGRLWTRDPSGRLSRLKDERKYEPWVLRYNGQVVKPPPPDAAEAP